MGSHDFDYCYEILKLSILRICENSGFKAVNKRPLNAIADIFQNVIYKIGSNLVDIDTNTDDDNYMEKLFEGTNIEFEDNFRIVPTQPIDRINFPAKYSGPDHCGFHDIEFDKMIERKESKIQEVQLIAGPTPIIESAPVPEPVQSFDVPRPVTFQKFGSLNEISGKDVEFPAHLLAFKVPESYANKPVEVPKEISDDENNNQDVPIEIHPYLSPKKEISPPKPACPKQRPEEIENIDDLFKSEHVIDLVPAISKPKPPKKSRNIPNKPPITPVIDLKEAKRPSREPLSTPSKRPTCEVRIKVSDLTMLIKSPPKLSEKVTSDPPKKLRIKFGSESFLCSLTEEEKKEPLLIKFPAGLIPPPEPTVEVPRTPLDVSKVFGDSEEGGRQGGVCPKCTQSNMRLEMIGCDSCLDWYHWKCVGITCEPDNSLNYFCPNCSTKVAGTFHELGILLPSM